MVFVNKKKRFEVSSTVNCRSFQFSLVVYCRSFPRWLTVAGFIIRQLTVEGHFRLLHVFLSQMCQQQFSNKLL